VKNPTVHRLKYVKTKEYETLKI